MYGETRNAECFVQTSNVRYGTENATIQRLSESKPSMHPPVTPAGNSRMISQMQSSLTSYFALPPHTPLLQSPYSKKQQLRKKQ